MCWKISKWNWTKTEGKLRLKKKKKIDISWSIRFLLSPASEFLWLFLIYDGCRGCNAPCSSGPLLLRNHRIPEAWGWKAPLENVSSNAPAQAGCSLQVLCNFNRSLHPSQTHTIKIVLEWLRDLSTGLLLSPLEIQTCGVSSLVTEILLTW